MFESESKISVQFSLPLPLLGIPLIALSASARLGPLTLNTFFDQGIFVRKSPQMNKQVVFVAVTDIRDGVGGGNRSGGLSWKPLSYDFNDSRYPRYGGGWKLVVFKNEDDTERKSFWVNVKRVLSNNITFKGRKRESCRIWIRSRRSMLNRIRNQTLGSRGSGHPVGMLKMRGRES